MKKSLCLIAVACALALSGCAASPLFIGKRVGGVTPGDIPRDAWGEPVWERIAPAEPTPPRRPFPEGIKPTNPN